MSEQEMSESRNDEGKSKYWPDETVDMISALVVTTALVAAMLWYVMNG